MKRTNKKGFTIVELVIVIAVIGILAAVLIPTISNVIQNARDAAYAHDRTTKQTEGVIDKIDNPNYMTWEDFEDKFAEALAKVQASPSVDDIKAAVAKALGDYDETKLSEAQLKTIIEKSIEGQLTDAQVKAIVEKAVAKMSISAEDVNKIVNKAVSNLPKKVGVSKEEMTSAIKTAIQSIQSGLDANQVNTAIEEALENFKSDLLTEKKVEEVVAKVLDQLGINAEHNEKIKEVVAKATSRELPASDNLTDVPVVYLDTIVDLDVTYEFSTGYDAINDYESIPKLNTPEDFWLADYEVSFNKDILPDAVVLGGYYELYKRSLGFPVCDPSTENVYSTLYAGTKVRLLQTVLKDFNAVFTYNDVVEQVGTFLCGVCVTNPDKVQKGTTITVELCLYQCELVTSETDGAFLYGGEYYKETGKRVVCETINYELNYAAPNPEG